MTDLGLQFVDAPAAPDTLNVLTPADAIRFGDMVQRASDDECWVWRGAHFNTGYPAFWLRGTNVGAHRVACASRHGLARGRMALHSCDNKGCVNPGHLRWGTAADNMQDRSDRGRAPLGEVHPNAKLTAQQVAAIRADYRIGYRQVDLARQYGVTIQAIHRIVNRKVWRHVP